MSRDTFVFTSASLRALRMEQDIQDWEDSRRALAHRRAMSRIPLPPAPRAPPRQRPLQEIRLHIAPGPCRDTAIHDIFKQGDMKMVYAVLRDPSMVNAPMETVHEEMAWAPEMGMWTLSSKTKQSSPLRLAAGMGHTCCVEELLFRGAEVNADPDGITALHDACAGGHGGCVQLLLAHGADANLLSASGSAPLHLCGSAHTFQCAELLLSTGGAEVNALSQEAKLTPLHVAARQGLEAHVELFLSHGADVLAQNREGETALNAACAGAERPAQAGQYLRVVQKLLRAGADPCTAGRKQHTPLHNACANCSPRIVEILLQHGARADAANCAGWTPMDCLLQVMEDFPEQQLEAVARCLLNHGAQPASPKTLKLCLHSPVMLEVILNCYTVVPPCEDLLEAVPPRTLEEHRPFFDSLWRMSAQPRSLKHLCRCALRRNLGPKGHSALKGLDLPSSLREYLLLRTDGEIQ